MTSFQAQLDSAYKKKVLGTLDKAVRAVALTVDAELVRTTPVDTGRARSNWLPSLNVPDTRIVEPGKKPELSTALSTFKLSDTILLTNNLPYIRRLNDGSSKQAPAGFVDSALAKGKQAIR